MAFGANDFKGRNSQFIGFGCLSGKKEIKVLAFYFFCR
jgi:hypothetical protein